MNKKIWLAGLAAVGAVSIAVADDLVVNDISAIKDQVRAEANAGVTGKQVAKAEPALKAIEPAAGDEVSATQPVSGDDLGNYQDPDKDLTKDEAVD